MRKLNNSYDWLLKWNKHILAGNRPEVKIIQIDTESKMEDVRNPDSGFLAMKKFDCSKSSIPDSNLKEKGLKRKSSQNW